MISLIYITYSYLINDFTSTKILNIIITFGCDKVVAKSPTISLVLRNMFIIINLPIQ